MKRFVLVIVLGALALLGVSRRRSPSGLSSSRPSHGPQELAILDRFACQYVPTATTGSHPDRSLGLRRELDAPGVHLGRVLPAGAAAEPVRETDALQPVRLGQVTRRRPLAGDRLVATLPAGGRSHEPDAAQERVPVGPWAPTALPRLGNHGAPPLVASTATPRAPRRSTLQRDSFSSAST